MADDLKQTVRIVRKKKVMTDDRGRTVWNVPVHESELELVSTKTLQTLLGSEDEERRKRLAEVAESKDGVLAQDLKSGGFEIIEDDDLKAALASADSAEPVKPSADVVYEPVPESATDEELSLVSTQMLRQMLSDGELTDDPDKPDDPDSPDAGSGGFDPYNSG